MSLGLTGACSDASMNESLMRTESSDDSQPVAGGGGHGSADTEDTNFDPCASCGYGYSCNKDGQCELDDVCTQNEDCPEGLDCEPSSGVCVATEQCGEQTISSTAVKRNVFIVLDRSCSMKQKIDGTTKWLAAVEAVNGFVAAQPALVDFGLELFPSAGSCNGQEVAVPLSPTGADELSSLLSSALASSDPNHPRHGPCRTPTGLAMEVAAQQAFIEDHDRKNFILLITDGQTFPCNKNMIDEANQSVLDTIAQLAAHPDHPVHTLVVGFGSKTDPASLNEWAEAGGMPATDGDEKFYSAQTPEALHDTLATVSDKTAGCEHELGEVPPDADRIFVYFDDQTLIERDESHNDGWDYDATTNGVRFYGAACSALEQGEVGDVEIVFGCPPDAPELPN